MTDHATLMAYLVPRLTKQVENAATEALGYILNRAPGPMRALNDLLREGGFDVGPIARLETQVTHEDGSRPDMAGYDENNLKRLLVEAKFGAALLEGQASEYARQLDQPGPATLLFIAPEVRIPMLWVEIDRQMAREGRLPKSPTSVIPAKAGIHPRHGARSQPRKQSNTPPVPTRRWILGLELIDSPPGVKRARVAWTEPGDTELQLVLVSWVRLLDRMDALAGDEDVKSDIRQLRGLAHEQDEQVFLPIHAEDIGPDIGRRVVSYNQLVDDAVDARGVPQRWMSVEGLAATAQRYGYGRYLRFSGLDGDFWFGVNHERWAVSGDTPLWLRVCDRTGVNMDEIGRELKVRVQDEWIPVRLKTGVEYEEVLNDVVSQLKAIARIIGADLTTE